MFRVLLALVWFILFINSLNAVQILGLFPEPHDAFTNYLMSDTNTHWTTQCIAMFRSAITLANQYKISVHGNPIGYTIFRTSADNNGFSELEFVCRSLINRTEADVVGIVGPAASTNTRFLSPFAAHVGLPLISYGATNAELGDILTYQTFYRTISSDALLAKAIVQLFKLFSWTTCIMILGKDDYGYGGLELLSEHYHANVSILDRLIFDPRLDRFHTNLKQTLEKSRSRIVLVWANPSSSTAIIQHALHANIIGKSYIWLITNQIDINAFAPKYWSKLQGILVVEPVVYDKSASSINKTLQKDALEAWRTSPDDGNTFPKDIFSISPFAMYAFDATWTLIQALNKSSFDKNSPSMKISSHCFHSLLINRDVYHMHLRNTNFSGVSGNIQFLKNYSNDRIDGAFYALYNIQWKSPTEQELKYEQVMTWYETNCMWKNSTGKHKANIIWPNNERGNNPSDYPQLRGEYLRILVIEAPPFVIVRNISTLNQTLDHINYVEPMGFLTEPLKTNNSDLVIYGLIADLISELRERMHFNYTIHIADLNTNYHTLVASVAGDNRRYDIVLSDIRITSGRIRTVDFSAPFHENTLRIITRQNPYSSVSLFSCFNPFTWQVWLAICAVILYSGVIIYLFEHPNIEIQNKKSRIQTVSIGIYQALSSILIMTGDVPLTTNSSRLTVLGLYALGIILVASYTANLSSFLTLNRAQSVISGIDDLKNGRIPFTRIGIITNSAISDYYIQNISTTFEPLESIEEMYQRLLDYSIDASIWDSSVIEYATNNYYCDRLTVVGVGFVKSSFGIVLPKDWLFKRDLDGHILTLRETQKLESLENKWLTNRNCRTTLRSSNTNGDSSGPETFTLDVLSGLFLTFLILTAIAVGLHIWQCRKMIMATVSSIIKRIKLPRFK